MPSVKLHTTLSQRLILTPQLKQRIDMLAMTRIELLDAINQELQENPVLEEVIEPISDAKQSLANTEQEEFTIQPREPDQEAAEPVAAETATSGDPFDQIDFGSFFQDYLDPAPRTTQSEVYEDEPSLLEKLTPERTNLYGHLLWQLTMVGLSEEEFEIAEAIVGNLNEDGYLDATIEEIAALGPWPPEAVEKALTVVQSLDPPGVGARNLSECLLLQLKERGWGESLAAKLVTEHLEDLQPRRLPELAKKLGLPVEALAAEIEKIHQLDPRPGRNYSSTEPQYIVPEVSIVKIGDEYRLIFNDDEVPRLRISPTYRRMLEGTDVSKEVRDFVRERFRGALELLKNIEHRKRAIYRVCEAVVRRQRDFLDFGPEYLKPMLLKDIAEELQLSLSTISRVVNNKYVETPQGVMELRRFFTEGLTRDDGLEISTRVIKLRIKELIEREDPRNPLTDDDIVNILGRNGIRLSRRTVTKYRKLMGIASSRDRRAQ
ncbi:MAG: RNA polymerase factor sigma-54 [Acidobacteria bacterium]|nr:RNA polymerase factor sigma-54 [Acidobacteriota bacterium]